MSAGGILGQPEFRVIAEALGDNQDLVRFTPSEQHINDENWQSRASLCAPTFPWKRWIDRAHHFTTSEILAISGATKRHRCTCIVNLSRSNTILRSNHLTREERDETMWNELILPHLQTRTYLQLVLEIKAVADDHRRVKFFEWALDSVQTQLYLL
jgi:hypothetical protein